MIQAKTPGFRQRHEDLGKTVQGVSSCPIGGSRSVQLRQGDLVRRPPICTPPNQRASREKIATVSDVFLPEELRVSALHLHALPLLV